MRLFTGISIPPGIVDSLAKAVGLLRETADLNWSPPENLHITLKFIGEWPQDRVPELKAALAGVPAPKPFDIQIARFGFFPNPHHPHTFFAGVHAGPELKSLAAELDSAMAKLGLAPEKREYSPHLTLARIKNQDIRALREAIASGNPPDFATFQAQDFHLYLSQAAGRRSVYSILETYSFAGSSARKEARTQ